MSYITEDIEDEKTERFDEKVLKDHNQKEKEIFPQKSQKNDFDGWDIEIKFEPDYFEENKQQTPKLYKPIKHSKTVKISLDSPSNQTTISENVDENYDEH